MYVHPFIKNILENIFYIHLCYNWALGERRGNGTWYFFKCIVRPSEFGGVDNTVQ